MHELNFLNLSFISFNNVYERETETETEGELQNSHLSPCHKSSVILEMYPGLMCARNQKSHPCVHIATVLPTEPPAQPQMNTCEVYNCITF